MEDRPASEDYFDPSSQTDEGDEMPGPTWLDIYYSWFNRAAEQGAAYARALGLL